MQDITATVNRVGALHLVFTGSSDVYSYASVLGADSIAACALPMCTAAAYAASGHSGRISTWHVHAGTPPVGNKKNPEKFLG